MKTSYSVTFEFEGRPPMTTRGVVEGGKVHTCVSRAVKEAQKALRPMGWSSVVCNLLKRLDPAQEPAAEGADDEKE